MNLKTLTAITLLLLASQLSAAKIDWKQKDKQLHFAGTYAIQGVLYVGLQQVQDKPLLNDVLSGGVAFLVNYGNELYQRETGNGVYNPLDIEAGAWGCVSGMIINPALNYVFDKYVW